MPLSDGALTIPGVGYVYTAPTGTPKPTDLAAPASPWVDMGHSSTDGLTISFEISTTKRRTWRAPAGVRVSVDEISFSFGWTALQWDNENLGAYFGGGDISAAGVFGIGKSPAPIERALFIRLVDGTSSIGLHVAKSAIAASGEATASGEDFAGLPLTADVLDHASATHLAELLAPHLGTPAGGFAPESFPANVGDGEAPADMVARHTTRIPKTTRKE